MSRSSRSFASTTFPIIPCMIAGSLRSAAPLARAPSNRESPRTLGGGGGSNVPNTSNAKNFAPWSLFPPHRHHRRRHHECHSTGLLAGRAVGGGHYLIIGDCGDSAKRCRVAD